MKKTDKDVCKSLSITQKQLAKELNVSEGSVNRWASDPYGMTGARFKNLSLILENYLLRKQIQKIQMAFKLIGEVKNFNVDFEELGSN